MKVFVFKRLQVRGEEGGLQYQRVSFKGYRKAGQLI
jgi:hypothetical protein